jgi:hypothetical protein
MEREAVGGAGRTRDWADDFDSAAWAFLAGEGSIARGAHEGPARS